MTREAGNVLIRRSLLSASLHSNTSTVQAPV